MVFFCLLTFATDFKPVPQIVLILKLIFLKRIFIFQEIIKKRDTPIENPNKLLKGNFYMLINKSKTKIFSSIIVNLNYPAFVLFYSEEKQSFSIIEFNDQAKNTFNLREDRTINKELCAIFPELTEKSFWDDLYLSVSFGKNIARKINLVLNGQLMEFVAETDFLEENIILLFFTKIEQMEGEKLRLGFHKYLRIFNITEDPIWLMDVDQHVLEANEATRTFFGIDFRKFIGKHCWEEVHLTKGPVPGCPFVASKKSKKRESMELHLGDKWYEITVDPILDKKGNFIGGIHIARDITKLKLIEQQLREKETKLSTLNNLFRLMADTMTDMMWAKDKDKRYLFANKAICENLLNAKDTDEPIGKDDMFFALRERNAHPENPKWHTFGEICIDSDGITMKAGKPMQFFEYGNVKGKFLYLDVRKAPMYNEKGELIGVVGSARDITEQKSYEKILKESEARYKELFEKAPVGYLILDLKGNILDANTIFCNRMKYGKDELIGKNVRELIPPGEKDIVEENISEILRKGELETEVRSIDKEGNIYYTMLREVKIKLPNGKDGILSASIDITEQKIAQDKLKEREEQLWSLINSTDEDIVCFKDGDGKWLLANDADVKLFHLEGIDYYGKTDKELAEFTHPVYRNAFLTCLETDKKAWEKKTISRNEEVIPQPDGTVEIFDVIKVPLFNSDGSRKGLVVLGRNITLIKEAQEKLKRSEKLFRRIWEESKDGMRLLNKDGIIVDVNDAFCRMVDLEKEELIGQPYNIIFKEINNASLEKFKKNFKKRNIRTFMEANISLHNGLTKWFEYSNTFLESAKGETLLLSTFRDITGRKKLFNELIEAKEKAEEINKLKTQFFLYMSHELRTPFMGIMGYTQILLDEIEREDHKTMLEGIMKNSQRMLDTLSNILDITKLEFDKLEKKITNVNITLIVKEISSIFKESALEKGIELRTKFEIPQDFSILTDERIIVGILQNLLNNAVKFTEGGYIEVSVSLSKDKKTLLISVKDTGIGIPEDKLEIIWEEFRQVSEGSSRNYQGSGLGLAIVKKYLDLIDGKISLKSSVGKGSEFTVQIPITKKNNNI